MSTKSSRQDLANTFRALHTETGDILVLPNAWDAMSARLIEVAGARAVATTSSGVSWSLGRPDWQGLTRSEMIDAIRRIVSAVKIPVSADVEGGYGEGTPEDVAETVRRVIGAGAVGINLEDAHGWQSRALLDPERQASRFAAARASADTEGVPLFINARIDVYLLDAAVPQAQRFDETVRRARSYTTAGADGVFVPGVRDADTIGRLAAEIDAPLNVMTGPGSPTVAELRKLGVARVSLGPGIAQSAMAHIRRVATEVLRDGTYGALAGGVPFEEADGMFERRK